VVEFLLQDVSPGVAYGLPIGYLPRVPPGGAISSGGHQRALYALGVAFLIYGLTMLPHGNGVIAVFVCAIVLGIRRPDVPEYLEMSDDIIEIVKLGVFVVFGSLLTLDGLFTDGWAAVAIVLVTLLVARTAGVWVALAGTRIDRAEKAFMAWFGPKGVATMTFSLLVLGEAIPDGERIFNSRRSSCCARSPHGLTGHARRGVDRAPGRAARSAEVRGAAAAQIA
jgi:NhaP-type Na+/H+ and K+/H+ antiporter